MNPRVLAAKILHKTLIEKHSLSDSFNQLLQTANATDKALVQTLCYGVCRWYLQLDFILKNFLEKPFKAKDQDIYLLLLLGFYQLMWMRIPPHAVVAETVSASKNLNKPWASGLVNAILRNYLRAREKAPLSFDDMPSEVRFSHPTWFINKLREFYPTCWQTILEANNQHPPFSLRVNINRLSREDYCKKLASLNLAYELIPGTDSGVILLQAMDVRQIPGFILGDVSVQDGGAQLAGPAMDLEPSLSVLDACAAPGGKLIHLLELEPSLICTAVDRDEGRLNRVRENLARTHNTADLITADAKLVDGWWQGQHYDRILLDAPCSATGVIRRHPDIKWLRQESDIEKLAEEQLSLLTHLWKALKRGGLLVYCTCSVLPEENSQVIEKFLSRVTTAEVSRMDFSVGLEDSYGIQILPGTEKMDGFYYSRLRKL